MITTATRRLLKTIYKSTSIKGSAAAGAFGRQDYTLKQHSVGTVTKGQTPVVHRSHPDEKR